jgi:hypothetical protein
MAGLVPAIHVFLAESKTWMPRMRVQSASINPKALSCCGDCGPVYSILMLPSFATSRHCVSSRAITLANSSEVLPAG